MNLRQHLPPDFPTIVCLCGSTRFMREFYDANMRETLAGKIVLSVGMSSKGDCKPTDEQKIALDVLHKRKIEMADEVLILNVGGYVGDSTRSELAHAQRLGKVVRFLEEGTRCGATMTGRNQHGEAFSVGPCCLSLGHVFHDGRPDAHSDGKSSWGGD